MAPRHIALGVLVAVIWGVNFVAIDLGLRDTAPLPLVALRFVLTAFPLVLFVRRPDASWRTIAGVGIFMGAGQFGLLFTAMHLGVPPGIAAVVLQCQAVFTLLIAAVVLRERPRPLQVAGAAVAVVGLALVAAGRLGGAGAGLAAVPLLIAVAAGLSWAIANVIARSAPRANGFPMVVWSATVVPVPILVLALLLDGPAAVGEAFATIGWETVVSLGYTVLLSTLLGYTSWYFLLARYPATSVSPFALLVPPVAILTAAVVLGETPSGLEIVGSGLLVGGVALGYLRLRTAADTPLRR